MDVYMGKYGKTHHACMLSGCCDLQILTILQMFSCMPVSASTVSMLTAQSREQKTWARPTSKQKICSNSWYSGGSNLSEALANTGLAMYNYMTPLSGLTINTSHDRYIPRACFPLQANSTSVWESAELSKLKAMICNPWCSIFWMNCCLSSLLNFSHVSSLPSQSLTETTGKSELKGTHHCCPLDMHNCWVFLCLQDTKFAGCPQYLIQPVTPITVYRTAPKLVQNACLSGGLQAN